MLTVLRSGLAFIGRYGTVAFALSIFLGLALPQLASAMRPFLAVSAFLFILLSIARTDFDNLVTTLSRPGRFAVAFVWSSLAMPVAMILLLRVLPAGVIGDDLLLGMALYAAAPPLMASPAYAGLLGFRNGLIIALLFLSLLICPLVTPPATSWLVGRDVPFDVWALTIRLVVLVGGAAVAGVALRAVLGVQRLGSVRDELNGFNVLLFFAFAIAAMDGAIVATLADPMRTLVYVGVAFALFAFGFLITLLAMTWLGPNDAFTLALATGLRNMGLAVAVLSVAETPPGTFLFFALMQFPIYLAPLLVAPLATRYRHAAIST